MQRSHYKTQFDSNWQVGKMEDEFNDADGSSTHSKCRPAVFMLSKTHSCKPTLSRADAMHVLCWLSY